MPNNRQPAALLCVCTLLLGGCATTAVSPDLLIEADDAIALAEQAGARDHAPLDLDEAEALRAAAAEQVEAGKAVPAARLVERATLQAQLAIVRAEASARRAEVDRRRADLEQLRDELRDSFGAAIDVSIDEDSQP
ncbi:MAG: hypothetical protein RQ729_12360 [Wenzhouxiangellaceae bacterium]|nr:hypothetical protein [Wenzhouxiangellaceae bacterium]